MHYAAAGSIFPVLSTTATVYLIHFSHQNYPLRRVSTPSCWWFACAKTACPAWSKIFWFEYSTIILAISVSQIRDSDAVVFSNPSAAASIWNNFTLMWVLASAPTWRLISVAPAVPVDPVLTFTWFGSIRKACVGAVFPNILVLPVPSEPAITAPAPFLDAWEIPSWSFLTFFLENRFTFYLLLLNISTESFFT